MSIYALISTARRYISPVLAVFIVLPVIIGADYSEGNPHNDDTDAVVIEEDEYTEDFDNDNITEIERTDEQEDGITDEEPSEMPLLKVSMPTSLDFVIDPFEFAERGQIYSDDYFIENFSICDVLLTITDIKVTYANDIDFLPLAEPYDDNNIEPLKAIYILLDFGRSDILPVAVTGEQHTPIYIDLSAAGNNYDMSYCKLAVSGSINPAPLKNWASGDVKISLTYTLEMIYEPETEIINNEDIIGEEDTEDTLLEEEPGGLISHEETEDTEAQDDSDDGSVQDEPDNFADEPESEQENSPEQDQDNELMLSPEDNDNNDTDEP